MNTKSYFHILLLSLVERLACADVHASRQWRCASWHPSLLHPILSCSKPATSATSRSLRLCTTNTHLPPFKNHNVWQNLPSRRRRRAHCRFPGGHQAFHWTHVRPSHPLTLVMFTSLIVGGLCYAGLRLARFRTRISVVSGLLPIGSYTSTRG